MTVQIPPPDGYDDPRAEGIADGVLRRFRERPAAELAKDKLVAGHEPANVKLTGRPS